MGYEQISKTQDDMSMENKLNQINENKLFELFSIPKSHMIWSQTGHKEYSC